jgi:hypothetical protein
MTEMILFIFGIHHPLQRFLSERQTRMDLGPHHPLESQWLFLTPVDYNLELTLLNDQSSIIATCQ